jgi:lipoprotein-releasing system permease protein
MLKLYFQIFYRYCFSNRAGSIVRSMARISWLGTLIGVVALILISSIMNGFNRSIRHKLLAVEPHIIVSNVDDVFARAELDKIPGITVAPFTSQDVILRSLDGHFSGAVAKGLNQNDIYSFLNLAIHLKYKHGEGPDLPPESVLLGEKEMIVGSELARDLNLFEGDEVMVIPPETLLMPAGEVPKYERMRVKTIVSTELPEIDDKLMIFRLGGVMGFEKSAVAGGQAEHGFELRLKNSDSADSLKETLQARWGKGAKIETWSERNRALFFALKLEKIAVMSLLGLSVLIASFSLITVLVLLISQKRKEIGLMMSLGLSAAKTRRLFLSLGVILSGFGLFGGLIIGLGISFFLEKHPLEILPDIYYDSALPSEISYSFVGGVAICCLAVAALSAYAPVRKYLVLSPTENLRPYVPD